MKFLNPINYTFYAEQHIIYLRTIYFRSLKSIENISRKTIHCMDHKNTPIY